MSSLAIASRFITALNAKDMSGAAQCLQADAVMVLPTGEERRGRSDIEAALNVLASIGDPKAEAPIEVGGAVQARLQTPMGQGVLSMEVRDGLISRLVGTLE